MFSLARIPIARRSSRGAAALIADYTAFERQRQRRRQYMKTLGGMALLVLVGGVFGSVPWGEAEIAAVTLATPALVLAGAEAVRRYRLTSRLHQLRADVRLIGKS